MEGSKLATLIELAIGQKFKVTMDGKLVHGIVVEGCKSLLLRPLHVH